MFTSLNEISRIDDVNIDLALTDNSVLNCQKVVRVIPNKRVVCQGVWQGKEVYAKLFLGLNAIKYAARDAAGVKLLLDAKIATPPLLYQGSITDNTAQVLIFAAITPALNAEQLWPDSAPPKRFMLAKRLVTEVAKHHNADLLQTDLYLKNFLITDQLTYTLDGDGIRKFGKLNDRHAMQNLIILLSKFDVLELEKWVESLVETYFKIRGWPINKEGDYAHKLAEIKVKANQYRLKVASDFADKKVFRQCTDVNITALRSLYIAASSDAHMNIPKNVAELEALMQPHNLLKNGNTCTVALAEIDNKQIVVKRYNIKNFRHGLSRAFRQTRAAASWANAHRLTILGIATAKPIALFECYQFSLPGFKLKSKAYFLAEYIDAPDVAQFFAQTQNKTERAEAVKNIVTFFYKLYLLQISHGDMKATNIKMHGTQPIFIDLDSMQQHRKSNPAAHGRDLRRFMQNWQDNSSLYNAFVKTFKVVYPDDSMLIKAGIATNKD